MFWPVRCWKISLKHAQVSFNIAVLTFTEFCHKCSTAPFWAVINIGRMCGKTCHVLWLGGQTRWFVSCWGCSCTAGVRSGISKAADMMSRHATRELGEVSQLWLTGESQQKCLQHRSFSGIYCWMQFISVLRRVPFLVKRCVQKYP